MEPVYQVWKHRASGEVYSVRLEWDAGRNRLAITGVCGPTDPGDASRNGPAEDDWYQSGSYVRELEARRHEFTILLPRQGGS